MIFYNPPSTIVFPTQTTKKKTVRFLELVLEYRQLEKFPAMLGGVTSYTHTIYPSTNTTTASSSSKLTDEKDKAVAVWNGSMKVERIIPEVIHGKVQGGGGGIGLSCTGRVSIKPLQHMTKSINFRRPAYRSIQVMNDGDGCS
jgi:hypothetical protein